MRKQSAAWSENLDIIFSSATDFCFDCEPAFAVNFGLTYPNLTVPQTLALQVTFITQNNCPFLHAML